MKYVPLVDTGTTKKMTDSGIWIAPTITELI
jgi:hypothetical protein